MLQKLSVVVISMLLLCCSISSADAVTYDPDHHYYELYHFAFRDYDGNGSSSAGDQVRYGFTIKNKIGDNPVHVDDLKVSVDGGVNPVSVSSTMFSMNGSPYAEDVYYGYNIWKYNNADQNFKTEYHVTLSGDHPTPIIENYVFNLPAEESINPYNGFDIGSLASENVDAGVEFSWDPLESANHDIYRLTLSNWDGDGYEIMYDLDYNDNSVLVDNALLAVAGTWHVQFQTRDKDPDTVISGDPGSGVNWLRQYSGSQEFTVQQTPVPGAAWLLGSGLIGLIGVRRRLRK